jgi:hypothetical protein
MLLFAARAVIRATGGPMSRLRFEPVVVCAFALAGCAAEPSPPPPVSTPMQYPLAVSSVFAPSGYMGDGANGTSLVNDTACAPRPTGARGDCYHFTYHAGSMLWSGVYWQFPANNWGAAEGKALPAGAKRVSFYAAGKAGGEVLKVKIGGIHDATLPFSDAFSVETTATLTTTMTQYTVDLTGKSYDKVIGGFSWVTNYPEGTNPANAPPIAFFLDDLVWE